MTVWERRIKLATSILNDTDEETLNDVETMLYTSSGRGAVEEIRQAVRESVKEIKAGKGVPHEDVEKHFAKLFAAR